MKYFSHILLPTAMAIVVTVGCGSTEKRNASQGKDHKHNVSNDAKSDMEKMKAALAKLSPEDAKAAEKQHVCPVSDEMLGTMGAPLRIDVKGQPVWICCDSCKESLLKDPDKFLAKLSK